MLHTKKKYTVQLSNTPEDPAWDEFLAQTDSGHHLQTSLWGQLKQTVGWQASRILLFDGLNIVGGAQLLHRPIGPLWQLAYLPQGPVLAHPDPELVPLLIQGLHTTMAQQRITSIIVQPPDNDSLFTTALANFGFVPSPISTGVRATVKLDLAQTEAEILANMKAKTRYNIRLGARKGLVVVKGSREDLPTFYKLLQATGQRQQFDSYPLSYFEKMWDLFAPLGYLHLFFTEFEGEKLSAHLAITFGDTVLYKKGAWSGRHGDKRPNEVMHWEVIQWGLAHQFGFYDFEGIELAAAHAVFAGEPLPPTLQKSTSRFKLGFSHQVVIMPPPQIYARSKLLRWGLRVALPWANRWLPLQAWLLRLRVS